MKKIGILVICAFVLIAFNGCGISNVPNEEQLLEDFISYVGGSVSYKQVEVDKRQTNKTDKEDVVYCTVFGEGEYANQNVECIMRYTYYDKGGWQLEDLETANTFIESGSLKSPDADIYVTEILEDPLYYINEDLKYEELDVFNAEYENDFLYEDNLDWQLIISFDMQKTTSLGYAISGRISIDYYYDISSDMWYECDSNYEIESQTITGLEGTWTTKPNERDRGSYEGYTFVKSEDGTYEGYNYIDNTEPETIAWKVGDVVAEEIDVINHSFHIRHRYGYDIAILYWDEEKFVVHINGRNMTYKKNWD